MEVETADHLNPIASLEIDSIKEKASKKLKSPWGSLFNFIENPVTKSSNIV